MSGIQLSEVKGLEHFAKAAETLRATLAKEFGASRVDPIRFYLSNRKPYASYDSLSGKTYIDPRWILTLDEAQFTEVVGHEIGHGLMWQEKSVFDRARNRQQECLVDQFGAYVSGYHGQGMTLILAQGRPQEPIGGIGKIVGELIGIVAFGRTHPYDQQRIEMLRKPDVVNAIPGTVTLDENCKTVKIGSDQDKRLPLGYYVARVSEKSNGNGGIAVYGGMPDKGNDDGDKALLPSHQDEIWLSDVAVRFYPTGVQGDKPPAHYSHEQIRSALGEEALAQVLALRQSAKAAAAQGAFYAGQVEGATPSLAQLHQKLVADYQAHMTQQNSDKQR